jgi:steroid 5-alpha reductase family enzyme
MSLFDIFSILVLSVIVYMTFWFLIARLFERTDLIDTAWGLGFVFVAWITWLITDRHVDTKLLAVGFVSLWGLRLAAHITKRNSKKPEDYRYVAYRQKWGDSYWPKAYYKLFLTQGLLLLIISLPIIAIVSSSHAAWAWLAVIGFIIWAVGMVFEAEADAELVKFVRHKKRGEIMMKGLWKYSRHPNYFGEVTVWWGAAIVAISYQQYWGVIGAALITFLITKVSGIPPLEKHYADNKAFQKYAKHTSVFIPLPPRK